MRISVLIADDHPIVRQGVLAILDPAMSIQVVGGVASFTEVLTALAGTPTDVLVLDIHEMGGSSLMFVARLRRDYPALKIIIFSSSRDLAPELLAAGVHGYIVKDDMSSLLVSAIQAVMLGQQFLSPTAQVYLDLASSRGRNIPLTDRELSILKLMSFGNGTKQLAHDLSLDVRTIQNYIGKLMEKIGCDERVQLVNWYRRVYGQG